MNQQFPTPFPHEGAATDPPGAAPAAVLCDASDWGALAIDGADATAFLQGQLSSDVKGMLPGCGQWTSYNSPKGRMVANGFLWRAPTGDGFRLALSSDIAEAARKRLAMFVLRSKVAIRDLTPTFVRIGIGGPRACPAAAEALGAFPAAGMVVASANGADVVALPDGRAFVVAPLDVAAAIRDRLAATTIPGDAAAWRRFAVQAGTALVRAATQDQLLPQAVNLDALGGVVLNREKGCFPGQEIIKRMQALGQLKERLYAYGAAARAPDPGTRLFGATFADQPCGIVVESAGLPEGGSVLLAVVQIRAAESDVLRLGAPDGPALSARPLPYEIPAVVPANRPPRLGS
jgi:hypothetical protein